MANVNVRLSDAEKETWAKAAKAEGLNLSDWIRKRCVADFTPARVAAEAAPILTAMQLSQREGITVAEATRRLKGRVQ